MNCCYAIIPDGAASPSALFESLEDALEWALGRYGANAFSIRHWQVARVERAERHGAAGPV
jgi:hypothetical protein